MTWYKTGTATVTNGSPTVTLAGANAQLNIFPDDGFVGPDGRLYAVLSVASATTFTLSTNYSGPTASAQPYLAVPVADHVQLRDLLISVNTLVGDYQTIANEAGAGRFPNGTAASPGVKGINNAGTGLVWNDDGSLSVSVNGVIVATFSDAGSGIITYTYTDLAAFKVQPVTNEVATLKTSIGGVSYSWLVGDYSAITPDDDIYIKSDNEPLTVGVWKREAALAAPTGSAIVGFIQSGTGAVARTLQDRLRDNVHAKDFGVLSDATDERTKMQAAVDAPGAFGGELQLPIGTTILSKDTNDACLTITNGVSLVGKGLYSTIEPKSDVGTTAVTLQYQPSGPAESGWTSFRKLFLGKISNGTRPGGAGFKVLTNLAGWVADRVIFEQIYVSPSDNGAPGFWHKNDNIANPTGGLFCCEFRVNSWSGGMKYEDTGDSILATTQTTTGHRVGLEYSGTMDVSGNMPSVYMNLNHNSTSELGAQLIHRGQMITTIGANYEQTVVNTGANLVSFLGDEASPGKTGVRMPWISNSLMSGFTGVGLQSLVYFGSCSGGVAAFNFLLDGGGGATSDIIVSGSSHDVWVGPNLSKRTDLIIVDNGVGTRGTTRNPALLNSWVDVGSGAEPVSITKSVDGLVTVWGACKGGTTTGGTTVFNLPIGFRPSGDMRSTIAVSDGGSFVVPGTLLILSTGEVQITYVPTANGAGNQSLHMSFSFRAKHANTITVA